MKSNFSHFKRDIKIFNNACYKKISKKFSSIFIIIDPLKTFRFIWDFINLILIAFICLIIPLEISFDLFFENKNLQQNFYLKIVFYSIFTYFIADMLLTFNTGYYSKGKYKIKRKQIFKHYMKTTFFLDFLSLAALFLTIFVENKQTMLIRIISCLFFFKIKTFATILSRLQSSFVTDSKMYNMFTLLKLILSTLFLSHIFSCLWHYLANYQKSFGINTWLNQYGFDEKPWHRKYLASYYYVCVTMNTVGYGDIVPQNSLETLYSIFFIYFACGMFAYTINSIGVIVQDISKEDSIYKKELHIINAYMKKRSINFDLRMRVHKYFEYFWKEEQTRDKEEELTIINKLSNSLKDELLFEANKNILQKLPMFFKNFSPEALKRLINCMREVRFTPNDIIFYSGDHNDKSLYIIKKGEVEFFIEDFHSINSSTVTINNLKKDDVFGEISFFSNKERQISAKSLNFCTCVVIRQEDFLKVLENFPDDYEIFCKIKDKINLYNNYEDLYIQCFCCKEINHLITDCPYVHYQPFRQIAISKYTYSKPQVRKKYKRWPKKDLNILRNYIFFEKKTNEYINHLNKLEMEDDSDTSESSDNSKDSDNSENSDENNIAYKKYFSRKSTKKKGFLLQSKSRRQSEFEKESVGSVQNLDERNDKKRKNSHKGNTLVNNNEETLEEIILTKNQRGIDLAFDKIQLFNYYFPNGNYDLVIQNYNEHMQAKHKKKQKKNTTHITVEDSKKNTLAIPNLNHINLNRRRSNLGLIPNSAAKILANNLEKDLTNQAVWVNLTNAFIKENEKKMNVLQRMASKRKKTLFKKKNTMRNN